MNEASKYLTADQLARDLNVPKATVYYWDSVYHDFPSIKMGRHRRFLLHDVIAYFESRTAEKLAPCKRARGALHRKRYYRSLKDESAGQVELQKKENDDGNL